MYIYIYKPPFGDCAIYSEITVNLNCCTVFFSASFDLPKHGSLCTSHRRGIVRTACAGVGRSPKLGVRLA